MSGPLQFRNGKLVSADSINGPLFDMSKGSSLPETVEYEFEADAATPPPKLKKQAPIQTNNLIGQVKARLKEIKSELKQLQALQKEQAELERLLAAAENKKPRKRPSKPTAS